MQVLVSDSSVLIELSKRDLLDRMFRLRFPFAVPDLLFNEELIDLGSYDRQDLVRMGLRVEGLDPDGVATAIAYQSRRRALSLVDCFALALAHHHGYTLLTEDRRMRAFAQDEGIPHHDLLWIIDHMHQAAILTASQAVAALEAMHEDPRCPVPKQELARRLRSLTLWEQRSMTHRALAVGPGTPAKPGETRTFERIQVLSRPFRTKTSRLEAEPLV